jgi:uncharacterized protein (TIGR02246 family)
MPMNHDTPDAVVQRQLDAYNAHDLDGWLATYAPDAQQFELPGKLLASGHAQIRSRMVERFTEPDLHARLVHRLVMGHIVVDHEVITRNFPEGKGQVQMMCVYEVRDGLIRNGSFALGDKRLD